MSDKFQLREQPYVLLTLRAYRAGEPTETGSRTSAWVYRTPSMSMTCGTSRKKCTAVSFNLSQVQSMMDVYMADTGLAPGIQAATFDMTTSNPVMYPGYMRIATTKTTRLTTAPRTFPARIVHLVPHARPCVRSRSDP